MASTAMGVVLLSGSMVFGNEWYQTNQINWRIPIATAFLGAIFEGLSKLDDKAALGLSFIVFIGAATSPFNGKSVAQELSLIATQKQSSKPKTTARVVLWEKL